MEGIELENIKQMLLRVDNLIELGLLLFHRNKGEKEKKERNMAGQKVEEEINKWIAEIVIVFIVMGYIILG